MLHFGDTSPTLLPTLLGECYAKFAYQSGSDNNLELSDGDKRDEEISKYGVLQYSVHNRPMTVSEWEMDPGSIPKNGWETLPRHTWMYVPFDIMDIFHVYVIGARHMIDKLPATRKLKSSRPGAAECSMFGVRFLTPFRRLDAHLTSPRKILLRRLCASTGSHEGPDCPSCPGPDPRLVDHNEEADGQHDPV
ncbi:unnamed protein product [Heligmosomoides polygyrus]|uniref:DDHD domain-containing protein n=1 Tax=Heligmosomoides polygyrus TaxID=6339 RepID=A0A183GLY2_HELPZ|nr:unnamed protein product [Heligmosomoides polygyrus]